MLCMIGAASITATTTATGSSLEAGAAEPVRFEHVDLFADSGTEGLGAYQVEVIAEVPGGSGKVVLVGVEGGDASASEGKGVAFAAPPVYDPEALSRDRIVIAAYTSLGAERLPTGRVRVARLHVQIESAREPGDDQPMVKPTYRVRVIAAGRADGTRMPAAFDVVPGGSK
ncbi:MAG: hypothetical protein AB7G11_02920 [Phycisphaerales bacterium]